MTELTPKALGKLLAERIEEFVPPLLPNGVRKGDEWCVGSVGGEAGESCKVKLTGDNAGLWKDWSKDDRGGDLLDLYAAVKRIPLSQAMRECAKWLGIEEITWGKRKQREHSQVEVLDSFRQLSAVPAAGTWLAGRGFTPEVIAKYKVFADVGQNGNAANVVFPYIWRAGEKAYHLKFRDTKQKSVWTSKGTRKGLYGWHALDTSARSVMLVEGEPDVLAAASYGFPQVLGIPNGGGGGRQHEWIETEWDELARFDTIYLVVEHDSAGMTAIHELAERLGRERCRVVKLPLKDINLCLQRKVPREEIVQAISDAKTLDPAELRNAGDFADAVVQRFHPQDKKLMGFYAPWASLMGRFEFEYGTTTLLVGFSGHGKTEMTGQIVLDAMKQGVNACVASLEFLADRWLQRTTRQAVRSPNPPPSLIRQAIDWMGQRLWVIDTRDNRGTSADKLIATWEYAYRRYGIRLFVLDNWQKLGIDDDDLTEQKRVINLFCAFSVRLNVCTIVVHHLRKNSDDDHQRGNKLHVKGSGAIVDMADNVLLVMRNRKKEEKMASSEFGKLPDEQQREVRQAPDTWLKAEKVRNGDEEPLLGLFFHRNSHTWTESQNEPEHVYYQPPKPQGEQPKRPLNVMAHGLTLTPEDLDKLR